MCNGEKSSSVRTLETNQLPVVPNNSTTKTTSAQQSRDVDHFVQHSQEEASSVLHIYITVKF